MIKLPGLQPAQVCVLRTNPEVNNLKGWALELLYTRWLTSSRSVQSWLSAWLILPTVGKKSTLHRGKAPRLSPGVSPSLLCNRDKAGFDFSTLSGITWASWQAALLSRSSLSKQTKEQTLALISRLQSKQTKLLFFSLNMPNSSL